MQEASINCACGGWGRLVVQPCPDCGAGAPSSCTVESGTSEAADQTTWTPASRPSSTSGLSRSERCPEKIDPFNKFNN